MLGSPTPSCRCQAKDRRVLPVHQDQQVRREGKVLPVRKANVVRPGRQALRASLERQDRLVHQVRKDCRARQACKAQPAALAQQDLQDQQELPVHKAQPAHKGQRDLLAPRDQRVRREPPDLQDHKVRLEPLQR